jgi:L-asparaginase II
MKSKVPLKVEVLRGSVVESQHHVIIAVVDERGAPKMYWGNPEYVTYPRSAIKMLQALPLIESGAAEAFKFENKHICLACSSHRGEKFHLAGVQEMMTKSGVQESQLVCGAHLPTNEASAHEMIRRGAAPTAICNNCSGKHTAMLATGMHLKENTEGYEKYVHVNQARQRKVLSEVMKIDLGKVNNGIDGCNIPTYAVPLINMAVGMTVFINPKETEKRKAAAEKIMEAVKAEPLYLSGTDDFTSEVIQKTSGRCFIKNGAEGVFCGVLPEKGLAFALKVEDGATRAAQVATAYLLRKLGAMKDEEANLLKNFIDPKLKNWSGVEVGSYRVP